MDSETSIAGVGGLFLGFVIGMLLFINSGATQRETQALEHGYAKIYEGNFHWNDDIQRRNLLKDLEFFKRNEENLKKLTEKVDMPRFDLEKPF